MKFGLRRMLGWIILFGGGLFVLFVGEKKCLLPQLVHGRIMPELDIINAIMTDVYCVGWEVVLRVSRYFKD